MLFYIYAYIQLCQLIILHFSHAVTQLQTKRNNVFENQQTGSGIRNIKPIQNSPSLQKMISIFDRLNQPKPFVSYSPSGSIHCPHAY